jgi:hypothetical protein
MGAVTTEEPPVLVGDHRTELDSYDAMGAADWSGLYRSAKGTPTQPERRWHTGFQTTRPVISLKTIRIAGAIRVPSANPTVKSPAGVPTGGQPQQRVIALQRERAFPRWRRRGFSPRSPSRPRCLVQDWRSVCSATHTAAPLATHCPRIATG